MKKYILIFTVFSLLVSCNQKKLNQLSQENAELKEEAAENDSTINEFIQTINEIEANLAMIKEKEDMINRSTQSNENPNNARAAIIQDLKTINTLMEENKQKIASLSEKVNNSDIKLGEFNQMVKSLNSRLEERKTEITQMQDELALLAKEKEMLTVTVDTLETKVSDLSLVNQIKTDSINQQIKALNTAYVTSGTYKDLKEKGVIDKEGGIIGIGSVKKLAEDFNKEIFEKIDISQTKAIPLNGKKATVITSHPSESYRLNSEDGNNLDSLYISDPRAFWKASKYLVILYE
ncbi:hypothetical protein QWY93_16775 [Echinicola jeungdonensis]|uniref:Uncharacterized protein n=1 Tax=Echinicola jeungdonensis TaxID=709343 RepID=A0ABV5J688_9BACT|nr:hypothetical protein [Echinicola jeungdonensis]MDN3670972.1 hypothetical protein [Echinicola jeungdonensis]